MAYRPAALLEDDGGSKPDRMALGGVETGDVGGDVGVWVADGDVGVEPGDVVAVCVFDRPGVLLGFGVVALRWPPKPNAEPTDVPRLPECDTPNSADSGSPADTSITVTTPSATTNTPTVPAATIRHRI
jgi:hypothetical protein